MSIGRRLKEYLIERRLTQEEFSALCRINKQTISNIVKDKTAPSGEVLVKIASEYNDLNLNWLITGKGPMFNFSYTGQNQTIENQNKNLDIILESKNNVIASQKETIIAQKDTIKSYKTLLQKLFLNDNKTI
jgi:transcriptional regulator with XRE-family HTH domain